MGHAKRNKLVYTIKDRCRVCYTCVRECPVKAIKIINGQAEVISERCIACGNCLTVCSQEAKMLVDLKEEVENMINNNEPVFALLAPSFPAEFTEITDYRILLGMIKKLGFKGIYDVAFGADLIAGEYQKLFNSTDVFYISSDCPAVVFFIEHYYPHLVSCIAPIASPMVVMARIVKYIHKDIKPRIVFIGPCIAKKAESDEIDAAITFKELRYLFEKYRISPESVEKTDFNPPISASGSIYPVTRGLSRLLKNIDDPINGKVLVNSGRQSFKEAIKEFDDKKIHNYHLELLCCEGCILGPGMSERNKQVLKRSKISKYTQEKLKNFDWSRWNESVEFFRKVIDLSQKFEARDRRYLEPNPEKVKEVLKSMGKEKPSDFLNCGACGYDTCYEHATAVVHGYAETEMCLPYTIDNLHKYLKELNESNEKLKNTQIALRHSEKLAHMGQISAGIAHELNNPLGVITMYCHLVLESLKNDDPIRKDIEIIVEQTERCRKIVSGLLNFARKNKLQLSETDIEEFVYSSLQSIVIPQNIKTTIETNVKNKIIHVDREQMMQALTNIEKNAIEAMPEGGELSIKIEDNENSLILSIKDTGCGIAEENKDKLFTPFFTTKEPGKGTGLGLSLVYGIIKMHKGKIIVNSNANPQKGPTGTEFKIILPRII